MFKYLELSANTDTFCINFGILAVDVIIFLPTCDTLMR